MLFIDAIILLALDQAVASASVPLMCYSARAGMERDRVLERVAAAKTKQRLTLTQGSYLQTLLQMDRSQHACTILTQHFSTTLTMPCIAFTPRHKEVFGWSELFGSMLKGKHEVITEIGESLKKFL